MKRYYSSPCWLGTPSGTGYSQIKVSGRSLSGHRISYEALVGPIPEGLELDHLCRNRNCYNPAHLEPVTHRENSIRGRNAQREKTHCPKGHLLDRVNNRRRRFCSICSIAALKKRRDKVSPNRPSASKDRIRCPRGHSYSHRNSQGRRCCRICQRKQLRESRARRGAR